MEHKSILDPQVRQRLRWIEHYGQITHKVSQTCRYFGISRGTFYLWYHRYMSLGTDGLRNKSSRPHKIHRWLPKEVRDTIIQLRLKRRYGPKRMSFYLRKKHNWFVSHNTVWRLYREHGLSRLRYKKKWQRYPQHYEKAMPGERLQIDVKFIEKMGIESKRYYQFTAIDDCTRYRVLRIYDHNTVQSANDFVDQVKQALPFAIKQIQTDNGSEFSEQFSWHLEDLGISHRKTHVCSPEENGKVERSHRTDGEEFYGINRFVSVQHCVQLLKKWEQEYNYERPHMALGGKTPGEYLAEKLRSHVSSQALKVPIKSVQEVC